VSKTRHWISALQGEKTWKKKRGKRKDEVEIKRTLETSEGLKIEDLLMKQKLSGLKLFPLHPLLVIRTSKPCQAAPWFI
jgi:hypothetical protein